MSVELFEKRPEEVSACLLRRVVEVEIEIPDGSGWVGYVAGYRIFEFAGYAEGYRLFDDGGTVGSLRFSHRVI
jgi:hypothetical protein